MFVFFYDFHNRLCSNIGHFIKVTIGWTK